MALKLSPALFQQLHRSTSLAKLLMAGKVPLQTHLLLCLVLADNFQKALVRLIPGSLQERFGLLSHLKTSLTQDELSHKGYQGPR